MKVARSAVCGGGGSAVQREAFPGSTKQVPFVIVKAERPRDHMIHYMKMHPQHHVIKPCQGGGVSGQGTLELGGPGAAGCVQGWGGSQGQGVSG